jgi:hypothetical protein
MVVRGKVTLLTVAGLVLGIWIGYREIKSQFGHDEARALLYFALGYMAFFGVLGLLCEWADCRRKNKKVRKGHC